MKKTKLENFFGYWFRRFYYSYFMRKMLNFFHYHELYIRSLAGSRRLRIDNSSICTSGNLVAEGMEYQYKEGLNVHRIIIESIKFRRFFMHFGTYFIEENRRITCSTKFKDFGYSGMWRIYDKGTFDIEAFRREKKRVIENMNLDDIPTLYINTKNK